jgi:hypothetical protein
MLWLHSRGSKQANKRRRGDVWAVTAHTPSQIWTEENQSDTAEKSKRAAFSIHICPHRPMRCYDIISLNSAT